MRIYIDMCAIKRPYDSPLSARIEREADAVELILEEIENELSELVWSEFLDMENDADPDLEVRMAAETLSRQAMIRVVGNPELQQRARQFSAIGLKPFDAAHMASAEASKCDFLVTCDDRFMRRAGRIRSNVRVLNPIQYLRERQRWSED